MFPKFTRGKGNTFMTDDELLRLIRSGAQGREKAARLLYANTRLRRGVGRVMGSGASSDSDYWNVFHTMIIQFFKYVLRHPDFTFEHNYQSYLIKAARNIWYMELRKRKNNIIELADSHDLQDSSQITIDIQLEDTERRNAIEELLSQFGKSCKEVLMGWAQGKKMQDIQLELGFSTVEAVRKRKFDCLKKISSYLEDNPGIRNMFE